MVNATAPAYANFRVKKRGRRALIVRGGLRELSLDLLAVRSTVHIDDTLASPPAG